VCHLSVANGAGKTIFHSGVENSASGWVGHFPSTLPVPSCTATELPFLVKHVQQRTMLTHLNYLPDQRRIAKRSYLRGDERGVLQLDESRLLASVRTFQA
jgi:hypothetical protein